MSKYLLVLFLFSSACFSETSLWEISKNGNNLYLAGTIHVLSKKDYPLPREFYSAFNRADKLIFETDIEKAQSPEFAQKAARIFSYPQGTSLDQVINKKTFLRLKNHLAARGVPLDAILKYKPSMIIIFLTMIELKKLGMSDIGVDQFFYNKAKKNAKAIGYFETIDEQLEFLRSMGKGNADDIIISTIKDMSELKSMMASIKSAWLTGDENKLAKVTLTEIMRDYPDLYKTLLVERNNNWMPHIERMMNDKKVEMVLVGALHLVGKDGLLHQLRNKGYTVQKFK